MANYIDITSEVDFRNILRKKRFVLVDYGADWCGPCRSIKPFVHQLADENPELTVCYVDADAETNASLTSTIKGLPTFQLYRDGKLVKSFAGANKPALQKSVWDLMN